MTADAICLAPLEESDFPTLISWITSRKLEVMWAGTIFRFPLDAGQLKTYLSGTQGHPPERICYKAVDPASRETIGSISFHRIDWENRVGRIGLVVVSPAHRGRGIGAEMVKAVLARGFREHKLHRIELVVFDFNAAAIRCYEKCGFVKEGLLRHAFRCEDEYWSVFMMSVLAPDSASR